MTAAAVRVAAVVTALVVAACGDNRAAVEPVDAVAPGVDAAAPGVDATAPMADAAAIVGTPEPAGGWPVSSRCAEDSPGGCVVVEAETWDRTGVASLVNDPDANVARLFDPAGGVIATIQPVIWFVPSGLTALPDGSWVIAGAALGPGELGVGADSITLPTTYNRIVARIAGGGVAWSEVIEGATAERASIAARTDGSVVIAGELMIDTTIAGTTLTGPAWVYDFFVAALHPDGTWAWALQLPPATSPIGDFQFGALALGAHSEAIVTGNLRGTMSAAGDTVVGPVAARAVASEAGAWLELAAE